MIIDAELERERLREWLDGVAEEVKNMRARMLICPWYGPCPSGLLRLLLLERLGMGYVVEIDYERRALLVRQVEQ